jgi:hypothetical protein
MVKDKLTVEIFLDGETLDFYKKLSKLAEMEEETSIGIPQTGPTITFICA